MRHGLFVIGTALVLAMAGSAFTQSDAPAAKQEEQRATVTVSGTLLSSSASELIIETSDGNRLRFSIDARTKMPEHLDQGSELSVTYSKAKNGQLQAIRVTPATRKQPQGGAS